MLNTLTSQEITEGTTAPVLTKGQTEERRRMTEWLDGRIAAGKKRPTAEVVTLTPCLARLLLEHNPVNRPISPRNAADLASDIANGRFEFNGESIVISKTGVLLDGQHRCAQVIATNKGIETVIVFGPEESARFTIDTGKSKTVADFLSMKGRQYTAIIGPAVNYFLQWRTNGFITAVGGTRMKTVMPTKAEILTAADELKGIDASAEFTAPAMKTVRSHAVLAFCHNVFWKRAGREAADHFIRKVLDGDGLQKGDPILCCRNRLMKMNRGVRAGERAELIFRAWNAHRNGERVDYIRLSGGNLPKVER